LLRSFLEEMEYARKKRSGKLIELLKERGFYPYSDLDRNPLHKLASHKSC
jgi:hypothetical protein